MGVDGTALGTFQLQGVILKVNPDAPLQLPHCKDSLHQAGRPDWMSACNQPARRVDRAERSMFQVQIVFDVRHEGLAGGRKGSAFSVATQAEVLIGLNFAGSVGVVELDEIQLV